MAEPVHEILIRNSNYETIGTLDEWTHFEFVRRFNKVGTWTLEITNDGLGAQLVSRTCGIIVRRDGTIIFSGFTVEFEKTATQILLSGFDDMARLNALALPTPSGPPYVDEYDIRTGVASTVMRSLVNVNIGPGAPPERKINALVLGTDPVLGTTITSRARFDPIITLLNELSITPYAGGLGFKLLQSESDLSKIQFDVYAPQDRRNNVKFATELDTAENFSDIWRAPSANYFYVGGGDDMGVNRTVVEGGDNDSIAEIGRFEAFLDKRGVTDLDELEVALAEALATAIASRTITIKPIEIQSQSYLTDWDLGDLVTFIVDGVPYEDLIREVNAVITPDKGVYTLPTIGPSGNTTDDEQLATFVNTVANRISYIERNWNVPDNSIIPSMIHETIRISVGDYKLSARNSGQTGWLVCNGSSLNRTAYAALFAVIGTAYGIGSNSPINTTFSLPDFRDKYIMGAGVTHSLATTGGSTSSSFNATYNHSHGLNNHTHASQAHTHPGSHSHGVSANSHTHTHAHTHDVDIASFSSGGVNVDTVAVGTASLGSGTADHHHAVNPPNTTSGPVSVSNTSGGTSFSTDSDSNVFAASYSGSPSAPSPSTTEPDSNTFTGSVSVLPPFQTVNVLIYTGVP